MHAEDWRFNLLFAVLLVVHYWWVTLPLGLFLGWCMWRGFRKPEKPRMTDYEWKRYMDSMVPPARVISAEEWRKNATSVTHEYGLTPAMTVGPDMHGCEPRVETSVYTLGQLREVVEAVRTIPSEISGLGDFATADTYWAGYDQACEEILARIGGAP